MDILVVDDNTAMRETIKSVLSCTHATFHQCSNGHEAIREYLRLRPDWVLMDIRMPDLDGLRAAEAIKACDPHAKVIIVTEYDDEEFRREGCKVGVSGYVLKSNLAELRELVVTL